MIYDKSHALVFLNDGISEAQESNEFCKGLKRTIKSGFGDDPRKIQLKNLQSGTEKILKALYLKNGYTINKVRGGDYNRIYSLSNTSIQPEHNKTYALGYLIHNIRQVTNIITDEDINTLRDINNSNEIKHGLQYQTNEIPNVRVVLNKIIASVND